MKIDVEKRSVVIETIKDVEVDPLYLLGKICDEYVVPHNMEYELDGHWWSHDYYNYHKGYNEEKKDRKLTDKEAELLEAYRTFRKLLKDKIRNEDEAPNQTANDQS